MGLYRQMKWGSKTSTPNTCTTNSPPKDIFGEVKIMLGAFLKHTNEAYSPILWIQHFHGAFIKHGAQIHSYTYTHKLYNVCIDYRQLAQQEVFFEVYALGKF